MRSLVLGLAVLLAGCAAPSATEQPESGLEPATLPPLPPLEPPRKPPLLPDECGRYTVTADPPQARVGEDVRLTVRLENCGDAPIARSTPCLSREWYPRVDIEGKEWLLVNGSAWEHGICLTAIGHWRVEPGEAMEESFRWNGTLQVCGTTPDGYACHTRDAPPGTHVLRSRLAGYAEEGPRWGGETVFTLLPRQ